MAKSDPIILGIDLQPGEVRIAEVTLRGGRPTLLKVGHAPVPMDAMQAGVVVQPAAVATAIRGLLDQLGIKSGLRGVYGIPAEACVLAAMVVPPAPESETADLVAGEIAHYGFLRSHGAQHNYIKLGRLGSSAGEAGTPVAVVGAEEHVITGLRVTAEMAGVPVAAIEPSSFALLRSSALATGATATFHLVVTEQHAETAFVHNGDLVSYRRLDSGDSVRPRAESLATEVRRSIEFLWRENAESAPMDMVYLAPSAEVSPEFVTELEQRMGLPVQLVTTPGTDDVRYAAAFGLAARGTTASGTVPKVDLYAGERAAVQSGEKRRNLAGSFAITALALVLGGVGFTLFGRAATDAENQANRAKQLATSVRAEADALVNGRRRQLAQYEALRKEGAPVDALFDTLGAALSPGVGIRSVKIDATMDISLAGEAKSEKLLIETLDRLRESKLLSGVSVRSFERPKDAAGLLFELGGTTLTSDRVRYAHEPRDPDATELAKK